MAQGPSGEATPSVKAPADGVGQRRAVQPTLHVGTEPLGSPTSTTEGAVLEAVFRAGRVSRAEIARVSGLSKPTVSSVIETFVAGGLVREIGQGFGQPGRPPVLYELAPTAGYVIGLDVGGTKVRGALANLVGEVIAEHQEPTSTTSAAAFVDQVHSMRRALLTKAEVPENRLEALSMGIPGIYNPVTDAVRAAYKVPALETIPFVATIGQGLSYPVLVDNDVNFAALGEQWQGTVVPDTDFVTIAVGTGIGMGAVIGGRLHRGATGSAGEIGSLPLLNPWLGTGEQVLENVAAGPGILRRLSTALADDHGPQTSLGAHSSVPDIVQAAADGDRLAVRLLDEETDLITLAVACAVLVLDPSLVVLGGGIGTNPDLVDRVRSRAGQLLPTPPDIEPSRLGNRAAMLGGIAVALDVAHGRLAARTSR